MTGSENKFENLLPHNARDDLEESKRWMHWISFESVACVSSELNAERLWLKMNLRPKERRLACALRLKKRNAAMDTKCGDINSSLATLENLKVKYVVSGTAIILVLASGNQPLQVMRRAYVLKSRAKAYCCLVDILGCGKLVEEAIRVVNQMPPEECDGVVLGDLLGACKLYLLE
ncbi:hypothetical protein RND71_009566 [Anisodus tanguticus]|uniref:Pentatricopeptide repeat-containing protein n=1 Tax=Anisodus tanguticus TaxID=243964 RepID=A0AAE1VN15_9SOLA|nr:hypothetical protein RND71_009566 [Anisodus tanguticus]